MKSSTMYKCTGKDGYGNNISGIKITGKRKISGTPYTYFRSYTVGGARDGRIPSKTFKTLLKNLKCKRGNFYHAFN